MPWIGVTTNAGINLMAGWTSGTVLSITKAVAGTGTVSEVSLLAQTALVNQKQVIDIVSNKPENNAKKIKLQLAAPSTGYQLNQIGLYACVDGGEEVLFALFQNDAGVPIPGAEESPDFMYTFYSVLSVSNQGEFSVNINTSAVVSLSTLEEYVALSVEQHNESQTAHEDIRRAVAENAEATETAQNAANTAQQTADNAQTSANQAISAAQQAASDASTNLSQHNASDAAHADIRLRLTELLERVNDVLDSDDETLDELHEIVAYIKSNKDLIDAITVSKVNVSDIVNNLVTNVANKPLSAAQGVAIKSLIDTLQNAVSTAQSAADSAGSAAAEAKSIAEGAAATAAEALAKAQEAREMAENSAGGCSITITFDAGFSSRPFTVSDGAGDTYESTVPQSLVATVSVKNCSTMYTISAVANNGVTYTSTVTTGPYYGQNSATLTVFAANIVVTATPNAVVTVTGQGDTFEATAGSNGKATIEVKRSGTYSVKARYSEADSNTVSVNASTSGNTYNATVSFITLTITVDSGSSVSVTNGSKTLTGTSTGTVKFYLPSTGTWNASATKGDQSASGFVSATSYTSYSLELSYVKVFGVCWNKTTSTELSRLTKANDPNAHVNVDISTEPSPAVGTGSGSSPFDNYAPWNLMEEYNIVNSAVSYKKGQTGFSRTANDTVVYIPEFYFKIVESGGKIYYYVADKSTTGFTKHPGSGKYVGRYQTISGYYSKSGTAPLTSITRAAARTGSANKGDKWSQYDYASWCAVWLLYLVEFADWDSQTAIGRGVVDGNSTSDIKATGGTDSMTYHTGRAAGTDGMTQVQYRGIEDPWGNVYDWIDGINFSERAAYVCTDKSKYADDTSTNYTAAGVTLPSSGWIKDLAVSSAFPWAFLPETSGGSSTTYIPDYVYSSTGWRVLCVGGGYNYASGAGLFYFGAGSTSSLSNANLGARLLYHP